MRKKFYKEEELVFEEKLKGKFKDIEGETFSRLYILGYAGKVGKNLYWYCRCVCGKIVKVGSGNLKNGNTTSCGCFKIRNTKEKNSTHGHSRGYVTTPTYRTWVNMINRCSNPKTIHYHNYGGRGIKVCDRWLKFENFLEDMGEKPKNTTIERIWNDGNYESGNCRWATYKEQNNNRRSNHFLTFRGKTQTIAQWSREIEVNGSTLFDRINNGWTVERALTTPVRPQRFNNQK